MRRRIMSACTAVFCLAQLPAFSMSAAAVDDAAWKYWCSASIDSYTETADGRARVEDQRFLLDGFLLITDGTELTAETLETLQPGEWYDWTLVELDFDPAAAVWDGDGVTAQENARCYQVYPRTRTGYGPNLPHPVFAQCAKQLMLENACITYAGEVECYADGYTRWDGEFLPLLANGVINDMTERFAEDEDYLAAMEVYASWLTGEITDYEALDYACSMAQRLDAKYPDGCNVMELELSFTPDRTTAFYSADDCWTNAGDYGKDGRVDASDASSLLVYAAKISAGTLQGYQDVTDRMDMNADGLVNSRDAAAILQYASAAGIGYDGSIVDFIRNK